IPTNSPKNDFTLKVPTMEGIHLLYLEINKIFSLSCQPICNSALLGDSLMHISVEVQRIIVRYIDEKNMSNRGIAKLLNISPNTVGRIRKLLQLSQENWSSLSMLSNDDFI
ncbi:hypothetical protein, partial [Acinetobacter soli]